MGISCNNWIHSIGIYLHFFFPLCSGRFLKVAISYHLCVNLCLSVRCFRDSLYYVEEMSCCSGVKNFLSWSFEFWVGLGACYCNVPGILMALSNLAFSNSVANDWWRCILNYVGIILSEIEANEKLTRQ